MGIVHRDLPPAGLTELRIHGVSGTPPARMLEDPNPIQFSGDDAAGFFVRGPRLDTAPVARRIEAYSWGGLTAGSARRALWLLLLPFTLVNVAFWMHPDDHGVPAARQLRERYLGPLIRLLGLSLTATMLLAFSEVAVDMTAWQCTASIDCQASNPLARLLAGRADSMGARLVLATALPLVLVAVLYLLAWRTSRLYEKRGLPRRSGAHVDGVPLTDPAFWDGHRHVVARLRAADVSQAFAIVALVPTIATRTLDVERLRLAGTGVIAGAVAITLVSTAVVLWPHRADGLASSPERADRIVEGVLLAAALALLAFADLYVARPERDWFPAGGLPGIAGFVQGLFLGQLLAVAAISFVGWRAAAAVGSGTARGVLRGQGPATLCALALVVAAGFSAGFALRGATTPRSLGDLLRSGTPGTAVFPPIYGWAALLAVPMVAVVAVEALALLRVVKRRASAAEVASVMADYAGHTMAWGDATVTEQPEHAAVIAKARRAAALTDRAPRLLEINLRVAVPLVLLAAVMAWVSPATPRSGRWDGFTSFGSWCIGAGALLLVLVGGYAYRRPQVRRTVGILWDLGTFWPRAAHPLAPPCYSERTVPDLLWHVGDLRAGDRPVIVSADSQGSVIAASVILRAPALLTNRMALVTYGSPLGRLFQPLFPAYFSPRALDEVAARLGAGQRWRNLVRATDPIGGLVHVAAVDEAPVLDPPVLGRYPAEPGLVAPEGHSGYTETVRYAATIDVLASNLQD